jgi:hypothetical protein
MYMTGTCALCGLNEPLLDSHFMPRSLYQELHEPNFTIKQMIVLRADKTNQSGQQFSMHLLCQACEIRFQQGGEEWTLGNRYRSDGSFLLRDHLLNASPVEMKPDGSRVFEARTVAGLALDRLVYFAVSIFWRAGIADWRVKFADAPKIDLDASLMTELQQYLLGKAPLPSRVSIFVAVDEAPAPWRAMWSPKKQNDRPLLRYSFYIPGMIMELGIDLPQKERIPSISDPVELIVLTNAVHSYVAAMGSRLVETSEVSKSLSKHLT